VDLRTILTELRQDHATLTKAIISIERLTLGQGKRRGQPRAREQEQGEATGLSASALVGGGISPRLLLR